jgi:tRNA modification GTPase
VPCDAFIWPNARSYTREPVVELHTFGSPPLLEVILSALCSAGARLAEPGEFTLRAFLAGRLDLTQAEAVLGVIDAQGKYELDAALRQLAGGIAAPLEELRNDLLQLLAELEAGLDFAEEDLEFATPAEILSKLNEACQLLDRLSEQMASRHTASGRPQVALVGAPNVGKSTLFNALVARCAECSGMGSPARSAALVSPQRGTTRDYLTATISLDGVSVELVDTAGVANPLETSARERPSGSDDEMHVERASQALAAECRDTAAVRAHCVVAGDFIRSPYFEFQSLSASGGPASDILVLTKCDLLNEPLPVAADKLRNIPVVPTSSRTGAGLDELCDALRHLLADERLAGEGGTVPATAQRCRDSMRLASAMLRAAGDIVRTDGGSELVSVEIRAALDEVGKVVGAVYTDDLLDRIFSTFCIGK